MTPRTGPGFLPATEVDSSRTRPVATREQVMGTITTHDGVEIFYKDWGTGQPIVFSH
jgi:hypothetical protein